MARSKNYYKDIACLESLWDTRLEQRLTVEPILRLAERMNGLRVAHLTCNTVEELRHNLRLFRRKRGYGILYLAFHGRPGLLQLPEVDVELEELQAMLGRGFRGWVVHFGTCETIAIKGGRLRRFMDHTGIAMAVGYTKPVDWMDAASTELLLLDWLQGYKNLNAMWRKFRARHRDLVRITGMKAMLA